MYIIQILVDSDVISVCIAVKNKNLKNQSLTFLGLSGKNFARFERAEYLIWKADSSNVKKP